MSDVISRQAAIEATWEEPTYTDPLNVLTEVRDKIKALRPAQPELNSALYTDGFNDGYAQGMRDAQGTSAQPEQRWIPVSERLPEKGKEVLVCYDFKGHRSVLIGTLYGDGKFYGYDDEYLTPEGRKYRKAVAWMPLPEPYKEV